VLAWLSVWSEVQTYIWPSWCHCHSLSLASVKSRLVLHFWYLLTWVVPEKGPLNGCMYVCIIWTEASRLTSAVMPLCIARRCWEIMRCDSCGSQGTHFACSGLMTPTDDYNCVTCTLTLQRSTVTRLFLSLSTSISSLSHSYISKPLMFTCPLFHEFHEPNKNAKLKGANADTVPISFGITVEKLRMAHH